MMIQRWWWWCPERRVAFLLLYWYFTALGSFSVWKRKVLSFLCSISSRLCSFTMKHFQSPWKKFHSCISSFNLTRSWKLKSQKYGIIIPKNPALNSSWTHCSLVARLTNTLVQHKQTDKRIPFLSPIVMRSHTFGSILLWKAWYSSYLQSANLRYNKSFSMLLVFIHFWYRFFHPFAFRALRKNIHSMIEIVEC